MPLETPHEFSFGPQRVAYVHLSIPVTEIQPALQKALATLLAALQAQSAQPTGAWFTHHQRRPTDTFDFDVCFPVNSSVEPTSEVAVQELAATATLRTVHRGNYSTLPSSWPEFLSWVQSNGFTMRGDFFEVYTVGPRDEKDSANWQTELIVPLAPA